MHSHRTSTTKPKTHVELLTTLQTKICFSDNILHWTFSKWASNHFHFRQVFSKVRFWKLTSDMPLGLADKLTREVNSMTEHPLPNWGQKLLPHHL